MATFDLKLRTTRSSKSTSSAPPRKKRDQLLQKNHLGCLLEEQTLFSAHVTLTPKSVSIDFLSSLQTDVKPLDILNQYLSSSTVTKAVTTSAFPSLKTLSRTIALQPLKTKELASIINFQIEPLLPYPLEQSIIDKIVLEKTSSSQRFLVFAVRKEDVQKHLEEYSSIDITPEIVAPKSIALLHFAALFLLQDTPRIIIDISAAETTCLLIERGFPLEIRCLPMNLEGGGESFGEAKIEEEGGEIQEPHLQLFSRELSKILRSFQAHIPEIKNVPITFTGLQERDPLILDMLGKLLGHETAHLEEIPPGITLADGITPGECAAYAVPIGLALVHSPFHRDKFFVNFRKAEYTYLRRWRRWKKDLSIYLLTMSLIAAALYTIGDYSLKENTHELKAQYATLAALHGKSTDDIEEAYVKANPTLLPKLLTALSAEDIQERFAFIQEKIKHPPELIALHPNIARVSDLLAWLTSKVEAKKGGVKLENISYTMIKRPEKEHPKEHYQVRVDLGLTAPSSEVAREFYDTLNTPNSFIDAQHEVQWNVQKGHYQTSFYLKDRTEYP